MGHSDRKPIKYEDKPTAMISLTDITERKTIELLDGKRNQVSADF